MSTVSPVTAARRWETSERVLDSGGFESRRRVVVAEPMVEASEAGARTLGVVYWQAVDRFTRPSNQAPSPLMQPRGWEYPFGRRLRLHRARVRGWG